jgi:hypothetical protein
MKVKVNWLQVLGEVVRIVLAALAGGAAGGAI